MLRAVLKHVPTCNMFQIGIVCCFEKCAFLTHVSDWHRANFVISKLHVKCKVLKHKICEKRSKVRSSFICLFVCLFFSNKSKATSNAMS